MKSNKTGHSSPSYYLKCAMLLLVSHELPQYGAFADAVSIFHDKTAYQTFENGIRVLVMLRLNDTYHEDIVVNVTVGELEGE